MKVFLVVANTLGRYYKPSTPHSGMAYLAAVLLKAGHTVEVLDMRIGYNDDALLKRLADSKPDLVGITGASLQHKIMDDLIALIKGRGYSVIVGGSHASILGNQILEETKADYAAIGEGEETILELADGKQPEEIKGLVWRKDSKIIVNEPRPFIHDLDKIPFPAYEIFEMDKYFDKKIPIISSRGCPFQCVYCSIGFTAGKRFRARSAENVVEEIEKWYKKGYRYFQFPDDCFSFDMVRAKKICDLILEKNLKLEFELRNGIRIDKTDEELLQKMKKAGCVYVAFGIESANQDVLNKTKKGLIIEKAKPIVQAAKRAGIKTGVFFIIGLPGDTFERFKQSLDYAIALKADEIRFYNLVPYPGTEIIDWIKQNGRFIKPPEEFLNDATYWNDEPVFDTPEFPMKERVKAYNIAESYVNKYLFTTELGKPIGTLVWLVWKIKPTRGLLMAAGKRFWVVMRKTKAKLRSS